MDEDLSSSLHLCTYSVKGKKCILSVFLSSKRSQISPLCVSQRPATTSEKEETRFLKVELLIHAHSHATLWELCSNNRSSEESDGAVARSDLCYVTCGPRNICSPSSLDMCGMNRSFPGESKLFACFNSLRISASSFVPSFSFSCQPSYFCVSWFFSVIFCLLPSRSVLLFLALRDSRVTTP